MTDGNSILRERTLTTRYQPRQQLPPNFPAILKEYARELLRAQPDDILDWSATYFKRLAIENDPLQAQQPPPGHYTPVVEDQELELLAQKLSKVLAQLDPTKSGVLHLQQVRQALVEVFHLTPAQALYILTADTTVVDDDDLVAYEVFARDNARAVQFFQQTEVDFAVADVSEETTVHGLCRSDVEQEFMRLFSLVDAAGAGKLPYADFKNALANAPVDLTQREVNLLSCESHRSDYSGDVLYPSEVPHFFDRLLLAEQFEHFDSEES